MFILPQTEASRKPPPAAPGRKTRPAGEIYHSRTPNGENGGRNMKRFLTALLGLVLLCAPVCSARTIDEARQTLA